MTRSRLDRWSEHGVRVGLFSALLGAATLFVCALVTWPVPTGIVLSYLAAFALGLLVRDQRRKLLAFSHHFLGEEVEAVHIADNDADVAAERARRLSGEQPKVELYDQANEPDYAGWAAGIRLDHPVEHLGQACGWSEDGTADCGDPAEGWATWPDGEVVWLCATHFQWVRQSDDDPADTLPRVLPEGRISD